MAIKIVDFPSENGVSPGAGLTLTANQGTLEVTLQGNPSLSALWKGYPLVNVYIAIENHHFYGKTHYQWPFSIAMLNYQRLGFWIDPAGPGPVDSSGSICYLIYATKSTSWGTRGPLFLSNSMRTRINRNAQTNQNRDKSPTHAYTNHEWMQNIRIWPNRYLITS